MGAPPTIPPPPADGAPATPLELALQREEALIGARDVRFATRVVQPPSALYVTADDGLYCLVSNLQAGLTLNLTATTILPDGRVQANVWQMTPPATGAQTAYLFPLVESFLLNVSVQPVSGVRFGQTWLFVAVRRGGLASGVNLQTLISNSVSSYGGPTWPGAALQQSIALPGLILEQYTDPVALGTNFVFTAPSFARVQVRSIYAQFITSATVINRSLLLSMADGSANGFYFEVTEAAIAASSTVSITWALGVGWAQTAVSQGAMTRSLPNLLLNPGWTLTLGAVNRQAGDQFRYVCMEYEQWFSF